MQAQAAVATNGCLLPFRRLQRMEARPTEHALFADCICQPK
jgi:hypothetical protein